MHLILLGLKYLRSKFHFLQIILLLETVVLIIERRDLIILEFFLIIVSLCSIIFHSNSFQFCYLKK